MVVVSGVRVRQILHVRVAAPGQRPVFPRRRGHDVIILRVHSVHRKMRVAFAELLGSLEALDQRAAREIAVHHQLEDVVVQTGLGEVPVIVVGLVEKVEPVQSRDPSHLDSHVEILRIGLVILVRVIHQLVRADDVIFRNHLPVVGVAVDPGDHVRRELKNLEGRARAVDRSQWHAHQHGKQYF